MPREVTPAFQGEAQFAGYTDSSRSGPRITLRLADRDELQRFVGLEGRRMMVVMVLIGDDETPQAPPSPAPEPAPAPQPQPAAEPAKGGELAKLAARLCDSEVFRAWVAAEYDVEVDAADACAHWMRGLLDVRSRAELDHDAEAAEAFHKLIRRPYAEWSRDKGSFR